jgi:hypothetical protein
MCRKKDGDEKYGGKTWQQQFHEASIEKSATILPERLSTCDAFVLLN